MQNKVDVTEALSKLYLPFAGYVIQTRAIPDSRDGLKTGARYILYAQKENKLTYDKRRQKAVKTVGVSMEYSPHGDASILGTAVRMSQNFSLRYPVIEVQGNNGSMLYGDDYSAARYLEMRSNKIADEMTCLLDKDGTELWKWNYTNDKQYPSVLPTKFPYGLVNGNSGIGVATSSSIPQFNLREVCNVLVKALYDSHLDFEDLYCPVDFATGGILVNESEVKESLKIGKGKSACLRAKIEYDEDTRELVVKELPYQVFTATVVKQLQKIIDEGKINGIESFFDGTDYNGVNIRIKLTKSANPEKVCRQLYKETPLQHHYTINMVMLENGKKPRVFSWSDMVYSYLDHLQNVMRRSYQYEYNKISARMNILEGYLCALTHIEEVVEIIKKSQNAALAISRLMDSFGLNEAQAKAILDLKLQRLVNMEAIKIQKEYDDVKMQQDKLIGILNDENLFKIEVEKEIVRIRDSYGDNRRTQLMDLQMEANGEDEEIPVEEKNLTVRITNKNNLIVSETSTLMVQKRAAKGKKVKLKKGEFVVGAIEAKNTDNLLVFTENGKVFKTDLYESENNSVIPLEVDSGEKICGFIPESAIKDGAYFIFATQNGMVKKTAVKEFKNVKKRPVIALALKEGDKLAAICQICDNEKIAFVTSDAHLAIVDGSEFSTLGRNAMGVVGVKPNKNATVTGAVIVNDDVKSIVTATSFGYVKSTDISDYRVTKRNAKGVITHKLHDGEKVIGVAVLTSSVTDEDKISFVTAEGFTKTCLLKDVKECGRDTYGTRAITLNEGDNLIAVVPLISEEF